MSIVCLGCNELSKKGMVAHLLVYWCGDTEMDVGK
jgi:hypothetical protein